MEAVKQINPFKGAKYARPMNPVYREYMTKEILGEIVDTVEYHRTDGKPIHRSRYGQTDKVVFKNHEVYYDDKTELIVTISGYVTIEYELHYEDWGIDYNIKGMDFNLTVETAIGDKVCPNDYSDEMMNKFYKS